MKKNLIFFLAILFMANVKAVYFYRVENRSPGTATVRIYFGSKSIFEDVTVAAGTRTEQRNAGNALISAEVGSIRKATSCVTGFDSRGFPIQCPDTWVASGNLKYPNDSSKQPAALCRDRKNLLVIIKSGGTEVAFDRIDR